MDNPCFEKPSSFKETSQVCGQLQAGTVSPHTWVDVLCSLPGYAAARSLDVLQCNTQTQTPTCFLQQVEEIKLKIPLINNLF